MSKDVREKFEQTVNLLFGFEQHEFVFDESDNEYLDRDINDLWLTYQAAHAESAARIAELEKDAARYRKLLNIILTKDLDVGEAYLTLNVFGVCPSPEEFDQAIDQAIETKEN